MLYARALAVHQLIADTDRLPRYCCVTPCHALADVLYNKCNGTYMYT